MYASAVPLPLVRLHDYAIVDPATGAPLLHVEDLAIRAGERTVITGPSGAGKSLLLAAIVGRPPQALRTSGVRESAPGLRRIGLVPQRGSDALHPLLAVRTQLRRATGATDRDVAAALDEVGLDAALGRRRPAELSGGQAQRVAIALARLSGAHLVVADEPTSALDGETRDEIVALLIERFTARDNALVVTTHDPAVAAALGTRRIDVADGRVRSREVAAA